MSPNVLKIGPICIQMVWMDLQNNEKIAHYMVLFWAFLGQILAILRITDQKNDQPFFEGKSLLLPGKLFV